MADSSCELASPGFDDWARAAASGEFLSVEYFLQEHPQARDNPQIAVRLIYEDYCQRQEAGFEVDPRALLERFPQWRSQLAVVLDCHALLHETPRRPRFPTVGEKLGEFLILAELGRGSNGRVFLATQPALSDRPVVIKLTPQTGGEHLSLARLQHSSIVPLYLVQDHEDHHLRLLCMPFVGGISLDRILKQLAGVPIGQRSGRDLAEALKAAQESAAVVLPFEGPALQFLARASYRQAVCWIGACLADALQYAHGRGLMHLDVKPSNILLAGDGQPMLLDFHLAHEMVLTSGARADWLGGTPDYMSPQQQQAIDAMLGGKPLPTTIDGRSDIYSLGLVLHELLTGCLPEMPAGGPSHKAFRLVQAAAPAAAPIVRKCLAQDPGKRYADAGLLAADLRGCLLRLGRTNGAHRRLNGPFTLAAALVALGCLIFGLSRALDRTEPAPLVLRATRDVNHARHARMAAELHELVERLQFLETMDSLPVNLAREVQAGSRRIWENRQALRKTSRADLDAALQEQICADLLDLATAWASLHFRLAKPENRDQAGREVLQVLNQAETELGSNVGLDQEQKTYAGILGVPFRTPYRGRQTDEGRPRTAREHYMLARALQRAGELAAATEELQLAIRQDPCSFWPNYFQGVCAYKLRRFEASLAAFSACIALAPDKADCFINRARAYQALGQHALAAHDLAAARELNPWRKIDVP